MGRRLYTLTGSGAGVGSGIWSGETGHLAGLGDCGWASVDIGGVPVRWRRSYLRLLLPDGCISEQPPSGAELIAELRARPEQLCVNPDTKAKHNYRRRREQRNQPDLAPATDAAAAAASQESAPLLNLVADASCVVVLFDTERRGQLINEMAATAMVRTRPGESSNDNDSRWVIPTGDLGRFSAKSDSFIRFSEVCNLIDWLSCLSEAVRDAANGAAPQLVMLAHGGPGSDWPALAGLLAACGLSLPPSVVALGCSRLLLVGEKEEELGVYWSMTNVYKARFGGSIKDQHTAVGDVRCVHARCGSAAPNREQ